MIQLPDSMRDKSVAVAFRDMLSSYQSASESMRC